MQGQNGFGVELNGGDGERVMLYGDDEVVVGAGGDGSAIGEGFGDDVEAMITTGGEGVGDVFEDARLVVGDGGVFAVHGGG